MITFQPLSGVPQEMLHTAFLDAFSDYAVDMRLSFPRFAAMLAANGFDPSVSVGAFDGDCLVGFVFCARRLYAGQLTLYDCGTGVTPAYRQQRIGRALLSALSAQRHASRFVLEVLQDNAAAIALYERYGLLRRRELVCYRCERQAFRADVSAPVTLLDAMPDILLAQTSGLWSSTPTWQNSTASVLRATDHPVYAVAAEGPFLLGDAVMHPGSGSISQIAVHPDYRGFGVGSSLLYALTTVFAGKCLCAINVDLSDTALCAAFTAWGFSEYARQYEMERRF